MQPSVRATAVTLRTYNRPRDEEGSSFESWFETIKRSTYDHHLRLWEEAGGTPDLGELNELFELGYTRKGLVSGRTLWLGGTEYAYDRACCQFNCSASEAATVYDVVDIAWLLLNGCGVGFTPKVGILHGYPSPIRELQIIPSEKFSNYKGRQGNIETYPTFENNYVWTIRVGDSAEAWAKLFGKLLNPKSTVSKAEKLVLDFSEVRGPGERLRGYGWICNGYKPLADSLQEIHKILNSKAGDLLDEIDIMDIVNLIGTVLSSRRAAEACELDATNPKALEFQEAKKEYWIDKPWRRQSNNSFLFWSKPTYNRILELLYAADEFGGDPGIVNAEGLRRKCPWFFLLNPCYEIALLRHGFCNLVSLAPPLFKRNYAQLERAVYLMARANYRQTCVDLRDDILQPTWHQTNESLRLCGISLTGIVQSEWITDYQIRRLRNVAVVGSYSMADELGMPRPKAITTVKPEGTRTKISGFESFGELGEGMHRPLGRYILNWINFSQHDPLVARFEAAGYRVMENPSDPNNMLVCFPVPYDNVRFDKVDGKEVNLESAASQFHRYLRWNNLWADHNVSSTISYSPEEIPELARLVHDNWDNGYVATAFLRRADPTKTARDLGHPYLPQEVVTQESFLEYRSKLREVDWSDIHGIYEIENEECKGGVCPIK